MIAAIVVLLAALLGGGHIEGAPAPAAPSGSIGSAIEGGNISQAIGLGSRYLAVRAPRGTLVRLCAARCVVMTSTDYGPSSKIRPPRIADVALGMWLRVCDKPASAGICRGSVEYLRPPHVHIELPATDTGD